MKILEILTPKRRLGNFGERAAVKLLKREGYKILERNYAAEGHEIDIIAQKGDTVAFIEVKTRDEEKIGRWESRPAAAVTPEKQRKIIHTAAYYSGYHPLGKKLRFDVIEVYASVDGEKRSVAEIKHIIGAFDKNSAYAKVF